MKIKEEFQYEEIKDYLEDNITLVIANPSDEERKNEIYSKYFERKKIVSVRYYNNKFILCDQSDLTNSKYATHDTLKGVLLSFHGIDVKNVLIDITNLQHVVIACILKCILNEVKPARVFLTYVKPEKYMRDEEQEYNFSTEASAITPMPGFAACAKDNEILIPFLGFEGTRLKSILGDERYEDINPIVGFPSDDPIWQFETLRYCKPAIVEQNAQLKIRKCKADSIYDAYYELDNIAADFSGKPLVIAPLGTRPHFVASVIYALKHRRECRIIYDNVVEKSNYSKGVRDIKVYHISRFIGGSFE